MTAVPGGGSLTQQTVGGLRWTFTATVATLCMQLLYTAIMGRLLEPRLFGLVASAQIVLQFGTYFSEMGLGQALIQKEELEEEEVRAAFTSSILLGVTMTGAIVVAAPALSVLFDSPAVVPVARALAFSLLLTSLGLTSANLLRRQLRFKTIAIIDIASYVIAYLLVGLGLAVAGFGVWSLVAAALTQIAIRSLASMAVARHGYRPVLALRRLRALYAFGGRVSLISGFEYIGDAVIVVVIGRNVGQGPLGQYNRAALLIDLPVGSITTALANVLFPAFSRVQTDIDRVRRAYLQTMRIVAALLFPVGAGVAVAAPQIVEVVLGDQWGTAALLLPALAGAVCLGALSFFGGITSEALGALNLKMGLQAAYVVLLVGGLLAVPSDFIVGYTLVLMSAELVRLLAYAVFMSHLLGVSPADHLRTFIPPVATAAAVAGGIAAVTAGLLQIGAPLLLVLGSQILTGAVMLMIMAAYGPLRRIRAELRDRIHGAFAADDAGRGTGLALRLLSAGDRRRKAVS